jgi:hypothetical protein
MSHPAPKLGGGSPFPTNYLLGSLSFKLERCIEDDETNQSQNKEVDPTNKQNPYKLHTANALIVSDHPMYQPSHDSVMLCH